jgi:hypothetical protein
VKNWLAIGVLAAAGLVLSVPALAQSQSSRSAQSDEEDAYDQEDEPRFALGVGIGLIDPSDDVEPYYMASLRIRLGGRHGDYDEDEENYQNRNRDWRGHDAQGIRGYLEAEVGQWETSDSDFGDGSDTLVGLNLLGVIPLGSVESFVGAGAGIHFVDANLLEDPDDDGSAQKIGVNAQFGLDVFITRRLSAFGVGRFDLVQDARDDVQTKIYLGLRGRF